MTKKVFDVIIYAWFTYVFESADRSGAGGEQAMFLPLYGIMQKKPEKAILKKLFFCRGNKANPHRVPSGRISPIDKEGV